MGTRSGRKRVMGSGEYTKTENQTNKKTKAAESQTQICPIIKEEIAKLEAFINHPKLISHLRTIP